MYIEYKDAAKQLGDTVRRVRKAKGLTLEQLSRKSGVSVPTLSHLENGASGKVSTLIAVFEVLGIRLILDSGLDE